jgi:hypothetical protein
MRRIILKMRVLFWCLLTVQVQAQVELRADSNYVETGNSLVLHLRFPAHLGKPDTLNFDVWRGVLPEQNIVNQLDWELEGSFLTKKLTAVFFDEDSLEIPALPISLRKGDTIYSNSLQIIVIATPSPDDLNDMASIKDIHREPVHWTDYWPWILGALGVFALVGLFYWMANRKQKSKIQSRSIESPPHELALKKLQALSVKQLTVNGLVKEHYAELTFILREYLEKRFGIPALESTTEETLGYLKKPDLDSSVLRELQTLLEQADLAKFAKIIPPESFHIESLELSRKIILQTSLPERLLHE